MRGYYSLPGPGVNARSGKDIFFGFYGSASDLSRRIVPEAEISVHIKNDGYGIVHKVYIRKDPVLPITGRTVL